METEQIEKFSNFITPPDLIEKENPIVVTIIDADWADVEALALWSQTSSYTFDVYLYHHLNDDLEWLDKTIGLSDAILINTSINEFSHTKDKIIEMSKAWYYGPKTFLSSKRQVANPIALFDKIAGELAQKV